MNQYIIITGGQLYNKGAEAMTYLAVDELSQKFPNAKMVVLSSQDYKRPNVEKEKYKFEILPRDNHVLFPLTTGKLKYQGYLNQLKTLLKFKNPNVKETKRLKEILENTILMVDISGFSLSSQFNPGISLNYISRILIAQKYNIPFYIMPQSFGPFNYEPEIQEEMDDAIGLALKYPKRIFAREEEGYRLLKEKYQLDTNLEYSMDGVLLNKRMNLENVFHEKPEIKEFDDISGVGIIPNMKTFTHGNKENIIEAYKAIIDQLLAKGKNVYIVRHSFEDLEACKIIKEQYKNNENVILIEDDMSCLDFDELVRHFDFIIGSRFHSIVHAYKNAVPSIAIGWATKYKELLEKFNQSDYIFDVRDDISHEKLIEKLNMLLNKYEKESTVIQGHLEIIQSFNPYDSIAQKVE